MTFKEIKIMRYYIVLKKSQSSIFLKMHYICAYVRKSSNNKIKNNILAYKCVQVVKNKTDECKISKINLYQNQ